MQPGQNINAHKITELQAQGLTVDDNNKPDRKPAACHCASQGHLKVCEKWAGMSWAHRHG
jgi:hypothetical protein